MEDNRKCDWPSCNEDATCFPHNKWAYCKFHFDVLMGSLGRLADFLEAEELRKKLSSGSLVTKEV